MHRGNTVSSGDFFLKLIETSRNLKHWVIGEQKSVVNLFQIEFVYGPAQVKCQLLISSIFYAMNFQHSLKMLEFNLWDF